MLFTTFDVIGTGVDSGVPIGAACSKAPFDDAVPASLWNELCETHRAPSDCGIDVWHCPSLIELELVLEGSA